MGRIRAVIAVVLIGLFAFLWPPSAMAASGERIVDFTASYAVQADGSVQVHEQITYQFAGDSSHGIKRSIVTSQGYDPQPDKSRQYAMTGESASSPTGAPTDLDVQDGGNGQTVLRIGSPDQTVSGTQKYDVNYTLAHVVNARPGDVEFYWNVLGQSTEVPVDHAKITLTGPADSTKVECYKGGLNSKDHCTTGSPGAQTTFEASGLAPGQGMTVVAAFPTSAFTDTQPDLVSNSDVGGGTAGGGSFGDGGPMADNSTAQSFGKAAGIGVPVLAAIGMGLALWRKGRDEQYAGVTPGLLPAPGQDTTVVRGGKQTVAVQFQPPKDVTPGLMGTVLDGRADTVDVSATIIDLAVRGYLRMEETGQNGMFSKADWQLTKLREAGPELLPYEQRVFDGVFQFGPSVRMSELRNHFSPTLRATQSLMDSEVVSRGWYPRSPASTRSSWAGFAMLLGFLAFLSMFFLRIPALAIGLGVAAVIVFLAGSRMAARTATGSAIRMQSLGFREYLETAEANQIRFEEAEQIFSRYMPYAVVFGIAKKWAATFQQVAQAAEAAGRPLVMPMWYIPMGGFGDFGGFGNIADGLSDFGTVASGTFSSTPGSSGGSGFSGGFGGGGFSGGGGGGGGTGSW